MARPRIAVTLGAADAVPHFALCQAVEKLGLESLCFGVAPAAEDGEDQPGLALARAFNAANFADFSQIVQPRGGKDSGLPQDVKIDLLIVNRPATPELAGELGTVWLPQLSERGIILFLHDGELAAPGAGLEHFPQPADRFTFDPETGACAVFAGSQQADRMQRLARLKPGQPGYLAACNVFARLGELHTGADKLRAQEQAAERALARQDKFSAELDEQRQRLINATERANALAALAQEHQALAKAAQSEASDLRQSCAELEAELSGTETAREDAESRAASLQDQLSEQQQLAKSLTDTLEERHRDIAVLGRELDVLTQKEAAQRAELETLRAEASAAGTGLQDLRQRASRQEKELQERYADIAALGQELEAKEAQNRKLAEERDAARKERDALRRMLGDSEHLRNMHAERANALEHSTSWRVTAPLRKVSMALKGK